MNTERNPCDDREYIATVSENLKEHIKTWHKGLKYSSIEYEYMETDTGYLKKYIIILETKEVNFPERFMKTLHLRQLI